MSEAQRSEPDSWVAELRLDPTAFVAPGALVSGAVTLGPRASVWFGTVVRGDTAPIAIGEATNIQDNTVVHVDHGQPAVVGARVTVGHRAIVHGCTIGDDCLIGMGAIVLSGARVGAGSLVGAGALVREGQEIPPGSLALGAPARVVGPVEPAHVAAIREGSAHYAGLALSYMRRGFARPHPLPDSDPGTAAARTAPMGFVEWERLMQVLHEGPPRAADRRAEAGDAWTTAPAPDRWSAHEIVCHLRDVDREIYLPRIERTLAEREPRFEYVNPTPWVRERDYASHDPAEALGEWGTARERLVHRLLPLGPDEWRRFAWHAVRGPYPLGHMVRDWADHDLSHRLQLAATLRAVL